MLGIVEGRRRWRVISRWRSSAASTSSRRCEQRRRVAGEGRCRRFTIIGEAGIGKTRLAGELISNLGEETTALVGRCTPYGKGSSYLPVAEMIREIGAGVEFSVLLGDDEHAELITRKLAMLTGEEDGAGSLGEAIWAVRRLFEALAREQRLTLVFEDLQWAEPPSSI